MKTELLSVVIPVHNSEKYLARCIESLLNQTYQKMEILLINDGSTDHSGSICNKYTEEYSKILTFHQKNLGANAARKKGILCAQGEYIAFVDSDDWVETDFFEILMSSIIKENADMITSNVIQDTKGRLEIQTSAIKPGKYTKKDIDEKIFPNMIYDDVVRKPGIFAYLWGKILIREQLLDSMKDLDDRLVYGEDGAIIFPMLAKINNLMVIDYAGYHYVQHDTSMTHNLSLDLFCNIQYLEEYLTIKFKKLGKYELVETQLHYFIRDLLFRIINAKYDVDCGKILCIPPFEEIPRNSRLIIYGAGKAGKEYVRLFLQNKYAKVVAWVDRYYEGKMYSYEIEKPESVKNKDFDYILIAISDKNAASEVQKYLGSLGIHENQIIWKEINWG